MKPRHLIVFLACLSPLGLAQVASEAARILDKIRLAHGGAALAALRTYQETATLTTFSGPETERTLTVVSYVDFTQNRLRIEYKDGSQLIQVIQVSPSGGDLERLGGKTPRASLCPGASPGALPDLVRPKAGGQRTGDGPNLGQTHLWRR